MPPGYPVLVDDATIAEEFAGGLEVTFVKVSPRDDGRMELEMDLLLPKTELPIAVMLSMDSDLDGAAWTSATAFADTLKGPPHRRPVFGTGHNSPYRTSIMAEEHNVRMEMRYLIGGEFAEIIRAA